MTPEGGGGRGRGGSKDGLHPGLAFSPESHHPPHCSPPASSTLACVSSPTKCTRSPLSCSPSFFGPDPVYTVLDPTSIQMLLDNKAFLWVPWSSLDKDHPSPPEALALLSLADLNTVTACLSPIPLFLGSASAHMTQSSSSLLPLFLVLLSTPPQLSSCCNHYSKSLALED